MDLLHTLCDCRLVGAFRHVMLGLLIVALNLIASAAMMMSGHYMQGLSLLVLLSLTINRLL